MNTEEKLDRILTLMEENAAYKEENEILKQKLLEKEEMLVRERRQREKAREQNLFYAREVKELREERDTLKESAEFLQSEYDRVMQSKAGKLITSIWKTKGKFVKRS